MKISVILAHPHSGSFNHAIADGAADMLLKSGHIVTIHNIYREQFDPLLPNNEIPRDAAIPRKLHCTARRSQQRTGSSLSILTGGECSRNHERLD